ncbi:MAG: hypothetical protein CMD20_07150 [Flavobacteriales bacterium]|nr:hypothetical protein [Flavobacteriales bacterium]
MKTIKENIGAFSIFILFFITGFAFVISFPKLEIQQYINSFYHPIGNSIFKFITHLAEGWFTVPLLIFLLIYNWRKGLYIGFSYAISSILVALLKRLVFSNFKRPHGFKELIENKEYNWLYEVEMPSNLSFPSGHTTVAFCVFFGLALIIPNKTIGTALVVLAVLVGFSRTYLSYHFLMDVVAGSLLGIVTAIGMYYALRKKLKLQF